ncbi:hypothetical protein HU200_038197 [Digitaria exilis]|uniref:Knottins-like domain-containing protein n=1 Tax=Digitaria exilis TaxID=1010633 RepID=A0A835EJE1_9POAL|nr:hypothetical protein HU200_038197 [Digitaria exilis]
MSFNKKIMAAGFTLAFLLVSFGAEAYVTVPCPLVTTMDCITDKKCRDCCINSGYDDGTCNGYLWACVCTKHDSPTEKKRSAEEKPVSVGLRRMGMLN